MIVIRNVAGRFMYYSQNLTHVFFIIEINNSKRVCYFYPAVRFFGGHLPQTSLGQKILAGNLGSFGVYSPTFS